jgi:hypothetical protein
MKVSRDVLEQDIDRVQAIRCVPRF